PRAEGSGHGLDVDAGRVAVLDGAAAHRRGQQAVGVGITPLDGLVRRGVAPHGTGDLEVVDSGGIEERTQVTAHARLAAVAIPRLEVRFDEAVDPRIGRPVRGRAPVDVAHTNEAARAQDA